MPQLRLGLAQVDLTVGDLAGNAERVLHWTRHAAGLGAHLVAFPEMTLTGYPPEDLVLRRSFAAASVRALYDVAGKLAADGLGDVAVVIGYLDDAGGPRNAAALVHSGSVVIRWFKHYLPNYGVFDEDRYFRAGDTLAVARVHGIDVAFTICEDIWQDGGRIAVARAAGVDLVVCTNGSPYERSKGDSRLDLVRRRAREAGAALAYVNAVGGQDELVFDGDSIVVDARGEVLARGAQFDEGVLLVDLDVPGAGARSPATTAGGAAGGATGGAVGTADGAAMRIERVTLAEAPVPAYEPVRPGAMPRLDARAEVYAALVLGTRDYVAKNGFRSVVLGLSGGIDSALVATIAVDALGAEAVHGVGMPGRWSSEHSLHDAEDLARRQGLHWSVVPITPVVEGWDTALADVGGLHGLAAENLQARIRGTLLMALSNEHGHLVLTTSNKSELATGYSTLYGDSAGGFAPIKDVLKTLVWDLARWRNATAESMGDTAPIPENSIVKPPSAELAPGQLDSDRLPAYDVLDRLLDDYIERDLGRDELFRAGHDPELVERVIRLVDAAEYKRRQSPPGPKISLKAFGRDRRLPITSRWREPVTPS